MTSLFDYLETYQYDSFYDSPINVLDILALTELSYLPFDDLVAYDFDLQQACRLDTLAQAFQQKFKDGYPPLSLITKERLQLLDKLASAKRFKHIKAFGYTNDYNLELEKQFAAICYRLLPQEFLTVFRGTDDTLIGWKEDFHMTYMPEIPAQKSASHYLTKIMSTIPGNFILSGHSKGGNLATYASSKQENLLQNHLKAIYSFDAPGVHESVLDSPGFATIEERLYTFIPQGSIIGLMLSMPKKAKIVKSNAVGLGQHIIFSWETSGTSFALAEQLDDDSLQIDQTLKSWTANLTPEELRTFFDLFFDTFTEAGIYKFSDLTVDTLDKFRALTTITKQHSPKEKQLVERAIQLLIDTRFNIWKENQPFLSSDPKDH